MFKMNNGAITMIKGDTAEFLVDLTPYEVQEGDTIKFEINDLILKEVDADETINLYPDDTKDLASGVYIYSAKLYTENDEVYTVLGPNTFTLEN